VNFRYGIVSEYGHFYWVVFEPDETSDANSSREPSANRAAL